VEPYSLGAAATGLAETLEALFAQGVSCLPEMSAAALCWWMERLAAAAGKTPAWVLQASDRLGLHPEARDASIAWLAAAEMVTHWPDRLYEFLDAFQQVPKHRNSSTGIALRFGLLLREAARLEGLGFPIPAQALRQYLLGRYAGGHLSRKVCLFQRPEDRQRLQDRAWITQTEAAIVLKLRTGAIPQLIQQGILTGQVQPAGSRGRSVGLDLRESVENLPRDLHSAVGVAEAATRLGIGPAAVRDLIHDGVLVRVARTQHGWRIPLSSLATLEALLQGTPPGEPPGSTLISLREATRISKVRGISCLTIARSLVPPLPLENLSLPLPRSCPRARHPLVNHRHLRGLGIVLGQG